MRWDCDSRLLLLFLLTWRMTAASEQPTDPRGRQFISINPSLTSNQRAQARNGFISPILQAQFDFNEAVVSWNVENAGDSEWTVEVRAIYPEGATKYYTLGRWSAVPGHDSRQSVPGQHDAQAKVDTDTLVLTRPARSLQVRIQSTPGTNNSSHLKFIGICLADSNAKPTPLLPERSAWDKTLLVPERSQMPYPDGKTLCSPTTVSMLLGFWSEQLKRSELDAGVPAVVAGVFDSRWPGAGNWPFNMAYAGSFTGMRAYVSRFSDVSELEQWIAQGLPVGLSVDYDRLRAKGPGPNGHLVVCVGFTSTGDPVINDPGTSQHVRKIFPRANLIEAWSCSRNTVYLVYPEGATLPVDRFGHWDSPLSRKLVGN